MKRVSPKNILNSEEDLLSQCALIEGLNLEQLADLLQLSIPNERQGRKGWVGQAVELALGATAGSKAIPDFVHLGIELKTLPLNEKLKPAESTFVTTIPLLTIHQENWINSLCRAKLKRVLWVPIESDPNIPFGYRRIGSPFLWSPSPTQEAVLAEDWNELTLMICTGRLEEINASMGKYLQIRPKAASARSVCYGFDKEGAKILTIPRGFYLRAGFTEQIIQNHILSNCNL